MKATKQDRIQTVGDVQVDLTCDEWDLNLHGPLPGSKGSESARGRFSFELKLERKSYVLTWLVNQHFIDFMQEVVLRQERQATERTDLGHVERHAASHSALKLQHASGMLKHLEKLISMDNIMDLAALVQRQGERVSSAGKEEEVLMEAMSRRHRHLLDEFASMVRNLPNGIDFLRKLIQSKDEQILRLALWLCDRVGQQALQEEIHTLAVDDSLSENLRQHAFGLLVAEQQWRVWEARTSRKRHVRRRG